VDVLGSIDANMYPFQRYNPHRFIAGILPTNAQIGRHKLPASSPFFRFCSDLCQKGGKQGGNPIQGFRLVNVEAILHEETHYSAFTSRQSRLQSLRQLGGDNFNCRTKSDFSDEQRGVLDALRDTFQLRDPGLDPLAPNTFYGFHGPRLETVESICRSGLVATGLTDAGYFGSGCYSTLNIEYAARYSRGDFDGHHRRQPPADGRFPVIMFAAVVSMAYPITPDVDYTGLSGNSDWLGLAL
jgi:hypothetical protein